MCVLYFLFQWLFQRIIVVHAVWSFLISPLSFSFLTIFHWYFSHNFSVSLRNYCCYVRLYLPLLFVFHLWDNRWTYLCVFLNVFVLSDPCRLLLIFWCVVFIPFYFIPGICVMVSLYSLFSLIFMFILFLKFFIFLFLTFAVSYVWALSIYWGSCCSYLCFYI